jgi:hypothetical protein
MKWDEPDHLGIPVEGLDGSCMTFLPTGTPDSPIRSMDLSTWPSSLNS